VFNAADCSVTTTTADLDNEDVTVSITSPGTGVNTPANQVVTGGNGTSTFFFSPTDILAGANTSVTFTATDINNGVSLVPAVVNVVCPGLVPAADTLYAIPANSNVNAAASEAAAEADAGSQCTIVVVTGDPANPFQYMTGVRVTFPVAAGVGYVKNSFNVGTPGGAADEVDGFWTNMGSPTFLLAPDSFYAVTDDVQDGDPALECLDFNVTPLGGSDVDTGSGALFNFKAFFRNAGTYTLGFQQVFTVNRTYYQDTNQAPDYFWGDITNVHAGVPNSVTVH
jgi:hypothetical protein